METRDLGTHSVELHEQGTLDIVSPVARITLPAYEAYELLQWLGRYKSRLYQAAQQHAEQQVPAALIETSAGDDGDEVDNPVDEP